MALGSTGDDLEQKCPVAHGGAFAPPRQERSTRRGSSQLPRPKGLPLLGNALQLRDWTKFHLNLENWADQFGPVYEFRIGWKPVVVLARAETISQLLRDRPDVNSRGIFDRLLAEIGFGGVATATGESWKKQRLLVTGSMNTKQLRDFFPTLTKLTQRFQKRLQTKANGQAVGVVKEASLYTIDVICNLGFAHDLNIIENQTSVVPEHLGRVLPFVARRLLTPFPYWRHFKLPADRTFDKSLQAVRDVITGCIALGRQRLKENPELAANPTNFMDVLLSAADGSDARIDDE